MKLIVAVLAGLAATVAAKRGPRWHELEGYSFDQYVRDFGKVYRTHSEHVQRKLIFEERLAEISAHNAAGRSWKMGVNHMSDLAASELKAMRGRSKVARASGRYQQPWQAPAAAADGIPASVDWVAQGVVTPLRDQGHCGSCWAHGTVEALESQVAINTGYLPVLSTQQLVACSPNDGDCGGFGGCQGSIPELGYEYLIDAGGSAAEWTYSYTSYWGTSNGTCLFKNSHESGGTPAVAKLGGYVSVKENDRDAVLEALATVGPLAVSVDASHWSAYEEGVFDGCDASRNIDLDHVVLAVGYGTTKDGQAFWRIKNSWGDWGEDGFMRLARPDSLQCGTDNTPADGTGCLNPPGPSKVTVCGTCGIAYDAVYPTNVTLA